MRTHIVLCVALLLASFMPLYADLLPTEILVVYNPYASPPAAGAASTTVASYYCQARGIPSSNKFPITWTGGSEGILALQFADDIYTPLRDHLLTNFTSDPNNPGGDIKCIVLCYGVPTKIWDSVRMGAVDSTLTTLLQHSPWGSTSAPATGRNGTISSPYADSGGQNYISARGDKPVDFGEFRASEFNDSLEYAPNFTIVRFLSETHAIAAGEQGIIYKLTFVENGWTYAPVLDEDRDFEAHPVTDICVVDSGCAWACSSGGSVLVTMDGGATWTSRHRGTVVRPSIVAYPGEALCQVSAYDSTHAYAVGYRVNVGSGPVAVKTSDGTNWSSFAANLPTGMTTLKAAAACDAQHLWIAGDAGMWFSSDDGASWPTQVSTRSNIVKIRVLKVGANYVGWAICSDGVILRTADGQIWQTDTSHTGKALRDIAVYNPDHAAIAYGSNSYLVWDPGQTSWQVDSTDTGATKTSVAVDGSGNALAVSGKTLRWRTGTWAESYTIPDAHWKMRYLVCRLDGYTEPMVNVPGYGNMPQDIKDMIDRSVASDTTTYPRTARNFVVDWWPSIMADAQANLSALIQQQDSVYIDDAQENTYITGKENVMGYYSMGNVHDSKAAELHTTWGRPLNDWCDGGVGAYMTSFDGASVRVPAYVGLTRNDGLRDAHTLKMTGLPAGTQYNAHWLGLYSQDGTEIARANFSNGTVAIDLAANWPSSGVPYCEIHFPEDDRCHPNEAVLYSSTKNFVYPILPSDKDNGVTYVIGMSHPHTSEFIREGASGATGHVEEPYGGGCEQPQYMFPRYAGGLTWAESAYLGTVMLGWQTIVLGDPLMAPYAGDEPEVTLSAPSEPNWAGQVPVAVSVVSQPDPGTGAAKVEFWLTDSSENSQLLATQTAPPYWFILDTTAFSDGVYTLRSVAYTKTWPEKTGEDSRTITICNMTKPASCSIAQPTQDGAFVDDALSLQAGITNAALVSGVDFWVAQAWGPRDCESRGSAVGPGFSYALNTSGYAVGPYTVYGVAHWSSGGIAGITGSAGRGFLVTDSITGCSSTGAAKSLNDDNSVALYRKPVCAGTSATMEGAFYIEEPARWSGIRVAWSGFPVQMGKLVSLVGTMQTNDDGERQIAATDVWIEGDADPVAPVGFAGAYLGGSGVTGGMGLNSVGLLARIWGEVVYVGDDFVYVDDGSRLRDGNSLQGPIVDSCDGSLPWPHTVLTASVEAGNDRTLEVESTDGFPTPPVGSLGHLMVEGNAITYTSKTATSFTDCDGVSSHAVDHKVFAYLPPVGIRITCVGIENPGGGDYVAITGISSARKEGENVVRYLRPRNDSDVTVIQGYTRCKKWPNCGGWFPGRFIDKQGNPIPVGSRVRLVNACIVQKFESYFVVQHVDLTIPGQVGAMPTRIETSTPFALYQNVTITGISGVDTSGDEYIIPDTVYLGGNAYGAIATASILATSGFAEERPGGGPFNPWPFPTADEILASESFHQRYNEPGAIGWALSQPDGTVVDLPGETVISESADGREFGLKESFEPIQHGPKLTLVLNQPYHGLTPWMPTIDIIGGTLFTLPDGRRAVGNAQAVYACTDASGRYYMMMPWRKSYQANRGNGLNVDWPWRVRIAP
jgi:photosystem II stability/assembly factor-like uncharacterized protein